MQTARDTYNQLEYAKKKGREEGREEGLKEGLKEGLQRGIEKGLEKGLKQGRKEIVTNMLHNGLSVQTICDCTGLSAEEITQLQNEVQQ